MSNSNLVIPRGSVGGGPPIHSSPAMPHIRSASPVLPHEPPPMHQAHHNQPQGVSNAEEHELKTRSLPTRCSHKPGRGGGAAAGMIHPHAAVSKVCEEDGFFYSPPLMEEGGDHGDENMYGSSGDLSSGGSILEKLMVWAYYSDPEEDTSEEGE